MIIPEHCREVALKKVDFPLDRKNIARNTVGKEAYYRTRYVVFERGKQHAVAELEKDETSEFFHKILSVKIVSLPKDTRYVEDENVDATNIPLLADFASRYKKDTVVIKGKFGHISFVHEPKFKEIHVIDVVPPFPPKLSTLISVALESGLIKTPVRTKEKLIDTNKLAKRAKTTEVMFACSEGGGKIAGKKCVYLDQHPDVRNPTIVGCDRTKKVSKAVYGKDFPFIDICPKNHVKRLDRPTIVKCCELQEAGFEKEGKLAIVPWGATVEDVVGAMKYLLGEQG
jgi:hypothetical protein